MTRVRSIHPISWRFWGLWLPTFLGFPLGGLLVLLTLGPIQTPLEALLGGLLSGALLGLVQWLALRSILRLSPSWIVATSLGMAVGLALAWVLFGSDIQITPLLARALVTGLCVGLAQAVVLRKTLTPLLWTVAITLLWPLAWLITSTVIRQNLTNDYAVFGSSGAIVFTFLSGLVLLSTRRH